MIYAIIEEEIEIAIRELSVLFGNLMSPIKASTFNEFILEITSTSAFAIFLVKTLKIRFQPVKETI